MNPISRRSLLKGVGAVAGGAALHLCSLSINATNPSDIVLVIVDALRADHVQGYGYNRSTAPNLNTLISQGTRFNQAMSPAPWTAPSNAALFTGRAAQRSWVNYAHYQLPPTFPTLAEQLKAAGYFTAAFNTAPYLQNGRGFGRGFDVYNDDHVLTKTSDALNDHNLTATALNWLNATVPTINQPLFLQIYYFAPHSWYNSPMTLQNRPNYQTLFTDPSYPPYDPQNPDVGWFTADNFKDAQDVVNGSQVPNAADLANIIGLYDGEIRYFDDELGALFQGLSQFPRFNTALMAVTSDHGQQFGEHGKWIHGNSLYQQVLHVPLVLKGPTIPTAHQIHAPVSTMDLMPTLLEFAGVTPAVELDAQSLMPLLAGQTPPERLVFSEVDASPNLAIHSLRSVRQGSWKYIHHLQAAQFDELYDLATDPGETINRINDNPAQAAELKAEIVKYFRLYRVMMPAILR